MKIGSRKFVKKIGTQYVGQNKILVKKEFSQKKVGLKSFPQKSFCQKMLVQQKFGLKTLRPQKVGQKNLAKILSVTAEILQLWTNVAWTIVLETVGIFKVCLRIL